MESPVVASWLVAASLAVSASSPAAPAGPQEDLYKDMEMVRVGPLVSSARAKTGLLWSEKVSPPTDCSAIRVHVKVRKGRAAGDWRIRFLDFSGQEIEAFPGDSPFLATGGIWSREIPGRGAVVELVTDTDAQGLEVAVDRYAYRRARTEASPVPIVASSRLIPIGKAPPDVQGWGRPVARLRIIRNEQQFICTGFLLTSDLLLTNEHCLSTDDQARSAVVDFGFDSLDARPEVGRVSKLEAVSPSLDYAIVRLSSIPPGFGPASLARAAVREGQALVIVQHPRGEAKQAAIEGCSVRAASLPGAGGLPTDFGHLCETSGGSAGSPVLDRETGRVVGLHHFGAPQGKPDPVKQAVQINAILDDLKLRARELYAELTARNN